MQGPCSSAATASLPETQRSLGILNLKRRHERPTDIDPGELLQVQLRGFAKIGDGLVNIVTLAGSAHLRTKCGPKVILSMNELP